MLVYGRGPVVGTVNIRNTVSHQELWIIQRSIADDPVAAGNHTFALIKAIRILSGVAIEVTYDIYSDAFNNIDQAFHHGRRQVLVVDLGSGNIAVRIGVVKAQYDIYPLAIEGSRDKTRDNNFIIEYLLAD